VQAWIEASTKGAVLIFAASEIETKALGAGIGPGAAGLLGGMGGGILQAYATMGALSLCIVVALLNQCRRLHDVHEDCRDHPA
jgi:hypothetical protein